jgi:S1-C subfamily serine protease
MEKPFRLVFASLLLIVLLALGTLLAVSQAFDGGLAALLTQANTTGQTIEAKPAVDIRTNSETQVSGNTQTEAPAQSTQQGIIDARSVVKSVGPAVVTVINNVDASQERSLGMGSPTALGTGVIIDNRGYIVTNNHVIENQQSLEVIFSDGKRASATLVGADPFSDLAVVKVDGSVPAVASFGDSDKLEPGEPVVAIGSALGDFKNTVTVGVVSGLHRDLEDSGATALQDLIQTDAAINHGNSGGPLLNMAGEVVGINTAVVRGGGLGDVAEGLGFSIPSNTVDRVADQLIEDGSVSRPFLGVSYMEITPQIKSYYELSQDEGIFVTEVVPGSPAAKAGIEANSIITRFDGVELGDDTSLVELLMQHEIGDSVKVTVVPPGTTEENEVTVVLGERPSGQ